MNGHCWADVPDIGVIAVAVTDGDSRLAQREADRIASAFWARRADFAVSAEAYGIEEAIDKALAAPESSVFLSDSGDNPGAGGSTDVPVLLEALLARGATSVLYAGMWDRGAIEACVVAGVGREITLEIGGKLDVRHGRPLRVTGVVRSLFDGVWVRGGLRQPMGRTRPGPIAVLNVAGIDIVLTSTRHSFEDPAQLRVLGLEPLDYRIVVLKRGYLTTEFAQIAPRSILAFTPGCTNCRVGEMAFRRVNRPMYPLDMAATGPHNNDKESDMINVTDADTGASLGAITEAQLKFLVDQMEEESTTDQDYWISADEIEMFEADAADPALIAFLRKALGKRDEMTIRWQRA
jgi:microcystin degradation protein MlrC